MPLSKARNRERMRLIRLHKATSPPYQSNSVQPKTYDEALQIGRERMVSGHIPSVQIDADGNPIYDD